MFVVSNFPKGFYGQIFLYFLTWKEGSAAILDTQKVLQVQEEDQFCRVCEKLQIYLSITGNICILPVLINGIVRTDITSQSSS